MKNGQQIYDEGKVLSCWPCDIGYYGETEFGGSEESLVKHKDKYYLMRTTWEDCRVLSCSPIDRELALEEDGHFGEIIKRAERGQQ